MDGVRARYRDCAVLGFCENPDPLGLGMRLLNAAKVDDLLFGNSARGVARLKLVFATLARSSALSRLNTCVSGQLKPRPSFRLFESCDVRSLPIFGIACTEDVGCEVSVECSKWLVTHSPHPMHAMRAPNGVFKICVVHPEFVGADIPYCVSVERLARCFNRLWVIGDSMHSVPGSQQARVLFAHLHANEF